MTWNKLLEKQIRNHLNEELLGREEIKKLLCAVNSSYNSYERDRSLSAHAFSISEQEFAMINQQLKEEVQLKKVGIKNLKEAILSIEGPYSMTDASDEEEDNLLFALSYLKESMSRQKTMEVAIKSSEKRLSASAKTFSQLIKNLNSGIIVEDEHRKIVLANQLFCDLMSISLQPDLLVGMDCQAAAEIYKKLFKDGEVFAARIDEILQRKELVTGEMIEMSNGTIVLRDYIPIFVEGEYRGNLWKFEDITKGRETQHMLQRLSLVASMNENGVLFTDADGTITWANEGMIALTGYAREEIIGHTPIDICKGPLSDRETLKTMLGQFYEGKSFDVEVIHYRRDGSWFWGKVKGQPILNEEGTIIQYFAMIEDITVRKQLELALIDAKEQAEQSSRAKEAFLANMSHEIRTPMNAILGMSRQLKKTSLNEQQRLFLGTVHSAADHLLVVINDILDISKIEAGQLVLEDIGYRLQVVAARVHRVMLQKAEEKGLRLSYSIDEALPAVMSGDPHRLSQILLNLVSNAVKFTHKGSVDIRYEPASGGLLRITVSDTGIGMDAQFIPHLFRKFVQEDEAVARKFGGTGLGMSICKQLVELMGGTIAIESIKGEGTSVRLEIPLIWAETAGVRETVVDVPDTDILKGKRLLLVEDNEMNRLVATTILLQYGAVVDEAINGQEALDRLRRDRYDLVLMDMQMPVMDGLEATRRIRAEVSGTLPVIALTANAIKGESDKCMSVGMNDYLSKPFEEEDLVRIIARWLGGSGTGGVRDIEDRCEVKEQLYDLSKLRDIGGGDEAFVSRMVQMFLEQVPAAVDDIRRGYNVGDLAAVKALVHRIRPVIDNMGIASLKSELKEMERLATDKDGGERLGALVKKLDRVMAAVVQELQPAGVH